VVKGAFMAVNGRSRAGTKDLGKLTKMVPVLERRAKLGCVSREKDPALEALTRHQVLSVASTKATTSTKRTQGGDGPQCVSVKGLSPVMNKQLWAPTCLGTGKATSTEPRVKVPASPPGSEAVARHQGRVGNSGDPRWSSNEG